MRGRCDQAECRQPAPILIRLLPADTAPLGHGAHTPDTLPHWSQHAVSSCHLLLLLIVVTHAKLSPVFVCSMTGPGHWHQLSLFLPAWCVCGGARRYPRHQLAPTSSVQAGRRPAGAVPAVAAGQSSAALQAGRVARHRAA